MRGDRSALKVLIKQVTYDCRARFDTFVGYCNSEACCELAVLKLSGIQSSPSCEKDNLRCLSVNLHLHLLSFYTTPQASFSAAIVAVNLLECA